MSRLGPVVPEVIRCKWFCSAPCGREKGAKSLIYLAPSSFAALCGRVNGGTGGNRTPWVERQKRRELPVKLPGQWIALLPREHLRMLGTISPIGARAAVGLHRSHPHAPSLDVLDAVMRDRGGSLADFGQSIDPCTPFGDILAEAFDRGMSPTDWRLIDASNTPATTRAALRTL